MNETDPRTPNPRIQIPKRLRKEVWEARYGKQYYGKCSIRWCTNQLEALGSWHVGHDKAVAKGGSYDLHNLYPLCDQCNLSMSTQTINEFSNLVKVKRNRFRFGFCCNHS